VGARVLTYENLEVAYQICGARFPFVRMTVNTEDDRFFTSWATIKGHRFHLWHKAM
jgi:hypothetical protein